jgi:hypothetical protein
LESEALQVKDVLLLPVNQPTLCTTLLSRARGLVKRFAEDALAFFETAARLTMGGQSTWLAPFQVGRCLGHLGSAIGAVKDPVFSPLHNLSFTLSLP